MMRSFEDYIMNSEELISNDFNKLIISNIYQLYALKYPLFKDTDLSSNLKIKVILDFLNNLDKRNRII